MVAGFQDDFDSDDDFTQTQHPQVASDDSDLDNDSDLVPSKSNVQRTVSSDSSGKLSIDSDQKHSTNSDFKHTTESVSKHSSDKEPKVNEIQDSDSDDDIPVTKDESDNKGETQNTQVAVALDNSDVDDNENIEVAVIADVSDIEEDDAQPTVTVAVDEDISEDEGTNKVVDNVVEDVLSDPAVNGESNIAQQPDFGDWLDELEKKVSYFLGL